MIGLAVVAAAGTIVSAWWPRVRTVTVSGTAIASNGAVRDAVYAAIAGRRWGLIPESALLWTPTRQMERAVAREFAFASVTIRRHTDGTLTVSVREHPIAAIMETTEGVATVAVGPHGLVIGQTPEEFRPTTTTAILPDAREIPRIRLNEAPPPIGSLLITPTAIALITDVWKNLSGQPGALAPRLAAKRDGSDDSWELHTVGGVTFLLTTGESADDQLTKLKAVLPQLTGSAGRPNAATVDLRYGDRVYVR